VCVNIYRVRTITLSTIITNILVKTQFYYNSVHWASSQKEIISKSLSIFFNFEHKPPSLSLQAYHELKNVRDLEIETFSDIFHMKILHNLFQCIFDCCVMVKHIQCPSSVKCEIILMHLAMYVCDVSMWKALESQNLWITYM